jgi:hypothetical protein
LYEEEGEEEGGGQGLMAKEGGREGDREARALLLFRPFLNVGQGTPFSIRREGTGVGAR